MGLHDSGSPAHVGGQDKRKTPGSQGLGAAVRRRCSPGFDVPYIQEANHAPISPLHPNNLFASFEGQEGEGQVSVDPEPPRRSFSSALEIAACRRRLMAQREVGRVPRHLYGEVSNFNWDEYDLFEQDPSQGPSQGF